MTCVNCRHETIKVMGEAFHRTSNTINIGCPKEGCKCKKPAIRYKQQEV